MNGGLCSDVVLHHSGPTPTRIFCAALHDVAAVRFFIEQIGLHPDASFGGKPSALCYAVLKPHPALLVYLLDQGADVSRRDAMAMTEQQGW